MKSRRLTGLAAIALSGGIVFGDATTVAQQRAPFPVEPVIDGALGGRLDAAIRGLDEAPSGAVLVARGDDIVLLNAYGLARTDPDLANAIDMPFDIGSMVKPFTAALILRLESEGTVSIDAPLSRYFEDVPVDSADVTLHQLLTHTAGYGAYSGGDFDPVSRDEALESIFQVGPILGPGAEWSYSNIGYTLLAAIADRLGEPYEKQLHTLFFEPLGMTHTGYVIPQYDRTRTPHAFADGVDVGDPLDYTWRDDGPGWNLRGNGGMYSTLHDLFRFWQALRDRTILTDAEIEKYFGAHEPVVGDLTAYGHHYGYGWFVNDTEWGTRLIQHSGGGPMTSDYRLYPDDDMVIITFANTWTPSAVAMSRALHAEIALARGSS